MSGLGFIAASAYGMAAAMAARRASPTINMHPDDIERALRGHASDRGKSLDDPEFADIRAELDKMQAERAAQDVDRYERMRHQREAEERRRAREIETSRAIAAASDAKQARKRAKRARAAGHATPSAAPGRPVA